MPRDTILKLFLLRKVLAAPVNSAQDPHKTPNAKFNAAASVSKHSLKYDREICTKHMHRRQYFSLFYLYLKKNNEEKKKIISSIKGKKKHNFLQSFSSHL